MSLDVLQRKNGSWFFRIRSQKLLAITGNKTYQETYDTEQEARFAGENFYKLITANPEQAKEQFAKAGILLKTVLEKYLREAVPILRSHASEGSRVRKLISIMGDIELESISIKFLEDYKLSRLNNASTRGVDQNRSLTITNYLRKRTTSIKTVSSQTVRHELGTLRRALPILISININVR